MNDFSRIITLLRKEKDVTQKQAALDLGVSQALLSHYENGNRECGLEFLVKLCDYYHVSSDYILGRTANRDGATLNFDDLIIDSSADNKYRGSILPVLNKRLIFSSLTIVYDKLDKLQNKQITTYISQYLMITVYKMFRFIYQTDKTNSQSMFNVSNSLFDGYTVAGLARTSANLKDALNDKQVQKQIGKTLSMTTQGLTDEYPTQIAGLLNIIKTSEDLIK